MCVGWRGRGDGVGLTTESGCVAGGGGGGSESGPST